MSETSGVHEKFAGKAVLVTGAGSGIGAATARAFAAAGASVCCADLNLETAQETVRSIVESGGRAVAFAGDVADEAANLAMVEQAVAELGGLDMAFLNAGVLARGPILETDVETWDRVIGINLRSVFLGLRAVVPVMKSTGGGAIAVTASVSGLRGDVDMALYTAAKHGVVGLVKCAAAEFAAGNIRVNAVAPGAVATPMAGLGTIDLGPGSPLANLHPLGRVGTPDDVAELVVFLCSDQAGFITGGIYPVDGGVMAVISPRYLG
ncbi:MAG: SDR family oxidoreductase [Gammaproteobacteria bacterium]|nr:SDR family oxidoreductase [Gammaproteobacteria bacterium]